LPPSPWSGPRPFPSPTRLKVEDTGSISPFLAFHPSVTPFGRYLQLFPPHKYGPLSTAPLPASTPPGVAMPLFKLRIGPISTFFSIFPRLLGASSLLTTLVACGNRLSPLGPAGYLFLFPAAVNPLHPPGLTLTKFFLGLSQHFPLRM